MSVDHIRAAMEIKLAPREKLVLLIHADCARADDGLSWPSVETVAQRSGMHARSVERAHQALVDAGLLVRHGVTFGGRGQTARYRVLPGVVPERNPGSTPGNGTTNPGTVPGNATNNPGTAPGYANAAGRNPGTVPGKPGETPASRHQKPRHSAARTIREPEPPRARAREAEPAAPAGHVNPGELSSVGDALAAILPGLRPSASLSGIPLTPSDGSNGGPTGHEAQASRHDPAPANDAAPQFNPGGTP